MHAGSYLVCCSQSGQPKKLLLGAFKYPSNHLLPCTGLHLLHIAYTTHCLADPCPQPDKLRNTTHPNSFYTFENRALGLHSSGLGIGADILARLIVFPHKARQGVQLVTSKIIIPKILTFNCTCLIVELVTVLSNSSVNVISRSQNHICIFQPQATLIHWKKYFSHLTTFHTQQFIIHQD